jgi:hypothetical protein
MAPFLLRREHCAREIADCWGISCLKVLRDSLRAQATLIDMDVQVKGRIVRYPRELQLRYGTCSALKLGRLSDSFFSIALTDTVKGPKGEQSETVLELWNKALNAATVATCFTFVADRLGGCLMEWNWVQNVRIWQCSSCQPAAEDNQPAVA